MMTPLKDSMFWFNQISPDDLPGIQSSFFNKGMNALAEAIAQGEADEYREVFGDDKRGDPLG